MDGSSVKVYRSLAAGGPETLVLQGTTSILPRSQVMFSCQTNEDFGVDNVMILADDLSRTTTLAYRVNNEIQSATTPSYETTTYTHDAWGRTSTEAANGVTKTYAWGLANLLTGVDSSDPNETDVGYVDTGDLLSF